MASGLDFWLNNRARLTTSFAVTPTRAPGPPLFPLCPLWPGALSFALLNHLRALPQLDQVLGYMRRPRDRRRGRSAEIRNPKFSDFMPHIRHLNLGGRQLGVDAATSDTIIPGDDCRRDLGAVQRRIVRQLRA
jgi:hypothetical protein